MPIADFPDRLVAALPAWLRLPAGPWLPALLSQLEPVPNGIAERWHPSSASLLQLIPIWRHSSRRPTAFALAPEARHPVTSRALVRFPLPCRQGSIVRLREALNCCFWDQ